MYPPLRTKYCRNWWHIVIIIIIVTVNFFTALTTDQDFVRCHRSLVYSLLQRVSVLHRRCYKFLYLPIPKESSNNAVLIGNFKRYFNPESLSLGYLLHQSSTEIASNLDHHISCILAPNIEYVGTLICAAWEPNISCMWAENFPRLSEER